MMNKKGMTLLELLVYMVLAALIMAPIIMLMTNSSQNMARDSATTNLRMSGRDILNVIYDDLKNTGFKLNPSNFEAMDAAWNIGSGTIETSNPDCGHVPPTPPVTPEPPTDLRDSSSFIPGNGAGLFDTLTVISGRLADNGTWAGADTIRYRVSGGNLERSVLNLDGTPKSTRVLTGNVVALKFQYMERDDLTVWHDDYDISVPCQRYDKGFVRYIKTVFILRDEKRLAPTNQTSRDIWIQNGDDNTPVNFTMTDQALYERHEVIVPIPNNGLFP